MQLLRSFSLLLVGLVVGCAAPDAADDEPTSSDESAIIGGKETSNFPDVGQITSGCTATLIHPQAMLTASHCCQRANSCTQVKIGGRTIGAHPTNHPEFKVAPDGGITPSVDVSILVLDRRVEDIKVRRLASESPTVGRRIQFVGFGCTAFGGAGYGTKRTGENRISFFGTNVDGKDAVRFADTFGWDSKPQASLDGGTPSSDANICPGDSGGPTLWPEGGHSVVAGVHSLVGPTFGYSASVAANRDFIDAQLAKLD